MTETISDLVIVGGGFAGAVTALKLLRTLSQDGAQPSVRITIVESGGEVGRGIAYSTDNAEHIVNGPAQLFGLYPDQPAHLSDWLAANAARHGWTLPAGVSFADAFPPRWLYGTYVQQSLQQALHDAGPDAHLQIVQGRAIDVAPATYGYDVVLADGRQLPALSVALALGLFRADPFVSAPEQRAALGAAYIDDVWNAQAWQGVDKQQDVLIIGSSLTALDSAFNAERAGFKGQFHALSRRGLLVQPRRQLTPWPNVLDADRLPATLKELLRAVRIARRAVKAAKGDWQQLPPAIRPHVTALWSKASNTDRQRFLRHIRPFWEIALHRAGPESGKKLGHLLDSGRLRQYAGRIRALHPADGGKITVEWTPRGKTQSQTLLVDRVVNAQGYEFDWARIDDPLVRALQSRKLVRRHATGFGIDADPQNGAVISAQGRTQDNLFAVGHPLRGAVWESNSIAEQLAGATNTANALAAVLQATESV